MTNALFNELMRTQHAIFQLQNYDITDGEQRTLENILTRIDNAIEQAQAKLCITN